jgi:hypothetical protein
MCFLTQRESKGAKAGDKGRKGSLLYFIAWEGYSADASTWEPASNVGAGATNGVPRQPPGRGRGRRGG